MKTDAYAIITDRILGLLEKGVVPWHKPWQGGAMLPRNMVSSKEYRGINTFLLHAMSYASSYWLTFNQAKELGGTVRQGEKACPVVFWKRLAITDEATKEAKVIPFLRYYSVFNVAQCDLPEGSVPALPGVVREHNPIPEAEAIAAAMPLKPEVRHGSERACYHPVGDTVEMPTPELFTGAQEYYSVLFHELTHSTGHEKRLNRKGVSGADGAWSSFGSTPYAKEELVAEMGSAFLCGQCGIIDRTVDNSAAYVASWLSRLKDDRQLVVQAAAQAQKAADFILAKPQLS